MPDDEEWACQHQLVVPKAYRPQILNMAHEAPLSGHLSVNKTFLKILKQFYWPNMNNDVAQFCQSCYTCQMVGKPNQTIPKANLQPIPTLEEQFYPELINCAELLLSTLYKPEYMLLAVMCIPTWFPEAIPSSSGESKTIMKPLSKFTCSAKLDFPKPIQSDAMSGLFQQMMPDLSLKPYGSPASHPGIT
jgi:hypothetical protein